MIYIARRGLGASEQNPSQVMINLLWYSIIITDIVRKIIQIERTVLFVRNGLYVVVLLYVLFHAFYKKKYYSIAILGISFALLFGLSIAIYPQLSVLAEETVLIFYARCITGFYLAKNIKDWKSVLSGIARWHYVGLFYALLAFFNSLSATENYMSFSYGLLMPAVISIVDGIYEKKVLRIVSGIVMAVAIFTFGARGPLLCIAIGISFIVFEIPRGKIRYKRMFFLSALIAVIFILSFSFENIIAFLYQRFPQARNLLLFSTRQFSNLSGRDSIFSLSIETIKRNPLIPRGLMADRIILGGLNATLSIYPHNFFLEIILQFGLFGWFFSIWLLYRVLQVYYRVSLRRDSVLKVSFVSFSIIAFVKSMFTGSYLSDMQFWFALGCLLSMMRILDDNI